MNRSALALAAALPLAACGRHQARYAIPPGRAPGVRAPLTAPCDALDPTRCLLPWPSSTFTALDPRTTTGLRVAIDPKSLMEKDDPASLNRADGFSTVTPIVAGFGAPLDAGSLAARPMRLWRADGARFGEEVPLRVEVVPTDDPHESAALLIGYPLVPLAPNADYVAAVTDGLRSATGAALFPPHAVLAALELDDPQSDREAALAAYQAPARELLDAAHVDRASVLRVWDFTTRSRENAVGALEAMREAELTAVDAGRVGVAIDSVTFPGSPAAAIVLGRVTGLPTYAPAGTAIAYDALGMPLASGSHDAPFRIAVPEGAGDYRVVMFGHGLGGSYTDDTFDAEVMGLDAAKVGISFYGWTGDAAPSTLVGLQKMFTGSDISTSGLMQALADGWAIERALAGPLGDALAAATLAGQANPAAGRRPDTASVIWAGGSLGGTMGLVYTSGEPAIHAAILNVPGAAWTHFVTKSNIFELLEPIFKPELGGALNLALAVAMSQSNWDPIDGAIWAQPDPLRTFLVQESIGDPVLPNPGSEMVAEVTHASQVGAALVPIYGLPDVLMTDGASGLTQYKVTDSDPLHVHGFAARDTPAGRAAREQIKAFLDSAWRGDPRVVVPSGCVNDSCDFSSP